MKNEHLWKPSRLLQRDDRFVLNKGFIYGGSYYTAELQHSAYLPVFKRYLKGVIMDLGCGAIPYYEVVKQQVTEHICIDHPSHSASVLFDYAFDLNETWPMLPSVDAILCSDVLAHIFNYRHVLESSFEHLKPGGHLVITSPFVYWMSEYPNEFAHLTPQALIRHCSAIGYEVVEWDSYGGRGDVLLDTLNKSCDSGMRNRLFLLLASLVKKSSWLKKNREKTKYSYCLGYYLVVRKP